MISWFVQIYIIHTIINIQTFFSFFGLVVFSLDNIKGYKDYKWTGTACINNMTHQLGGLRSTVKVYWSWFWNPSPPSRGLNVCWTGVTGTVFVTNVVNWVVTVASEVKTVGTALFPKVISTVLNTVVGIKTSCTIGSDVILYDNLGDDCVGKVFDCFFNNSISANCFNWSGCTFDKRLLDNGGVGVNEGNDFWALSGVFSIATGVFFRLKIISILIVGFSW